MIDVEMRWSGGTGNNLHQLAHAILYAKCVGARICMPPWGHLWWFGPDGVQCSTSWNYIYVTKQSGLPKAPIVKTWPNIAFDQFSNEEYSKYAHSNAIGVFRKHIAPSIHCIPIEFDDSCPVLHLRSDDVYGPCPHPRFIQAPLSYIIKILQDNSYRELLICKNRGTNPMQEHITNYCNANNIKINFSERDVRTDAYIMLNCKILICGGHSSFCNTMAYCSDKLKLFHFPQCHDDNHLIIMLEGDKKFVTKIYDIANYLDTWTASASQINLMQSHSIEHVNLIRQIG